MKPIISPIEVEPTERDLAAASDVLNDGYGRISDLFGVIDWQDLKVAIGRAIRYCSDLDREETNERQT